MTQSLDRLKESPSQTAGPYVHIGLTPNFCGIGGVYDSDLGSEMVNEQTKGERIELRIRVLDGTGTPLKDALIEIWQADVDGLYNSPAELRGTADPDFWAGAASRQIWKPVSAGSRRSSPAVCRSATAG